MFCLISITFVASLLSGVYAWARATAFFLQPEQFHRYVAEVTSHQEVELAAGRQQCIAMDSNSNN